MERKLENPERPDLRCTARLGKQGGDQKEAASFLRGVTRPGMCQAVCGETLWTRADLGRAEIHK